MISFVVLTLIAAACAAPQSSQEVKILRNDVNNDGLGSYSYAWELSDGTKHEEQGELKNQGTENEAFAVRGQYSWIDPNGDIHDVNYIADENGFQPQIDQGPSGRIPAAIVALLGIKN